MATTTIGQSIFKYGTMLCLALCLMSFTFGTGDPVSPTTTLPAGTPVKLETTRIINSEFLQLGQTVEFKVSKDVVVDNKVLIKAGSIAKGQVSRADKAKALGKEGRIEIQIKSVQAVDGQEVMLFGGNVYKEGEDKQTLAILLGVLVCILCLLIKGKEAVIMSGTPVDANVASNMQIADNQ